MGGMELQYEIEGKEDVERCFVHIDYEKREYDEHLVSKVPELQEHLVLRHRHNNNPREVELNTIPESNGNSLVVVDVEDKHTDQQAQHEEEKEKRASIKAIL